MALEDIVTGSKEAKSQRCVLQFDPNPPQTHPPKRMSAPCQITPDAAELRLLFPHTSSFV